MTRAGRLVPVVLAIALAVGPGPLHPEMARAEGVGPSPAPETSPPASGASPWSSLALPGLSQGLHGEPLTFAAHLGGTAALAAGLWAAQYALFYRDSTFVPPEQQAAMILQGTVLSWLIVGGVSVADAFRFSKGAGPQPPSPSAAPRQEPAPWTERSPAIQPFDVERPSVPRVEPEPRRETPIGIPFEPPSAQAKSPPARRPGGTIAPEQRILEAYDLAARGRMWEAVKRISRVTEPGWQPKVRALLAEWGPRAAAAGFSEAIDALDSGLVDRKSVV